MSIDSTDTEYTTLGDLLRQTRIKQGLDLEQISFETKISVAKLKAIENDDYNSLPPEAFARGFYTLYANALSMEPEEVLRIYTRERGQLPNPKRKRSTPPPSKQAEKVDTMAERSTVMPLSCTGLIIFFLLVIGAFVCWYFSWNPATLLSEKLRSFKKTPESGQVIESTAQPDKKTPLFEMVQVNKNEPTDKETAPEQSNPKSLSKQ